MHISLSCMQHQVAGHREITIFLQRPRRLAAQTGKGAAHTKHQASLFLLHLRRTCRAGGCAWAQKEGATPSEPTTKSPTI